MKVVATFVVSLAVAGCHGIAPNPIAPSQVPSRLTLSASPAAVLLSGSTALISARLVDASGVPVAGELVRFVTNSGSLSAAQATTTDSGVASVTLTASGSATVSATGPGIAQVNASVAAVAPFALAVNPADPVYVQGSQVTVTVTPTTTMAAPAPAQVWLRCGAETVPVAGTIGVMLSQCSFPRAGTFDISATGTTANGWTGNSPSVRVTATDRPLNLPAFNVALTVTGPSSARSLTLTAIVTPDARLAATYAYDFGDGERTGPINTWTQTHFYHSNGTYTVSVTVRSVDGRTLTESRTIVIAL